MGNRVDSNQNGASIFNDGNQLTEDADFTYQYDNNGNLIQKTDKSTSAITLFEYDADDKLIRVASLDKTVNYKYDGLGRRVEKEVTETAVTTTTQYIYDNEDILLELDDSNNITARYTHGPGVDEPLIIEKGGASFFYHADGLGSVADLTDGSAAAVQSYTYSSFGKIESQLDPNFVQPYTYTAREFDPETGLYFYRARYYDPSLGRFLQEDPIAAYRELPQSINRYPYVFNAPANWTDPLGLEVQLCRAPALIGGGYVDHFWIKTDTKEAGMGGEAANPGDQYESLYVTEVEITDHTGQSETREGASCRVVPNTDEEKVNELLEIGEPLGKFSLFNNCGRFAVNVLNQSRITQPTTPAGRTPLRDFH